MLQWRVRPQRRGKCSHLWFQLHGTRTVSISLACMEASNGIALWALGRQRKLVWVLVVRIRLGIRDLRQIHPSIEVSNSLLSDAVGMCRNMPQQSLENLEDILRAAVQGPLAVQALVDQSAVIWGLHRHACSGDRNLLAEMLSLGRSLLTPIWMRAFWSIHQHILESPLHMW